MALGEMITETWQGDGNKTWYKGYWTFDNSYATGGEARPTTAGVTDNKFAMIITAGQGTAATGLGYDFELIPAGQLIVVTWANAGTAGVLLEVTNTTDLSALTAVPFICIGD